MSILEGKRNGLAAALLTFHVFAGADYTAAFYSMGKVRLLKMMEEDKTGQYIKAFKDPSTKKDPDEGRLSNFVCGMYGYSHLSDVDEVRLPFLTE